MSGANQTRRRKNTRIRKRDADPIILYTSNAQGFEFPETLPTTRDSRSNAKGKGRRKDRPDREDTLSDRRGRHAEDNEDSDQGETFSDPHGRRAAHSGHSDREDTLSDRRGRDADLRSEQEIGSELSQEEQVPHREVTFSGHRGMYAERNSGQQEIAPRLRDLAPEKSAEADNYDSGYDYESPRSQITEEWAETFDLEQAQRCRPGAELDEYLHRTSMTYQAFVLIRDMAEQLQAQKTSTSASRQVMVTETPMLLDSKVTFATIKEFEDYLTRHHQQADITARNAGITTHARQLISPRILGWARGNLSPREQDALEVNPSGWLQWTHERLFYVLRKVFPNIPGRTRTGGSLLQALSAVRLDASEPDYGLNTYQASLIRVSRMFPDEDVNALTAKEIDMHLLKPLIAGRQSEVFYSTLYSKIKQGRDCNSLQEFLARVSHALINRLRLSQDLRKMDIKTFVDEGGHKRARDQQRSDSGGDYEGSASKRRRPRMKDRQETNGGRERKHDQPRPEQKDLCQGCGRTGHTRDKCMLSTHPDFNKNGKWADSAALRAIKARLQSPSDWVLSFKTRADGSETERSTFRTKRSKGTTLATLHNDSWCEDLLSCVVGCGSDRLHPSAAVRNHIQTLLKASPSNLRSTTFPHIRAVNALLDTGALQANYVSPDMAEWLQRAGTMSAAACEAECCRECILHTPVGEGTKVCAGLSSDGSALGRIKFTLHFFNELTKSVDTLSLTATVIYSQFDLIVGSPTIKQYDLVGKLPSHFRHVKRPPMVQTTAALSTLEPRPCGSSVMEPRPDQIDGGWLDEPYRPIGFPEEDNWRQTWQSFNVTVVEVEEPYGEIRACEKQQVYQYWLVSRLESGDVVHKDEMFDVESEHPEALCCRS